MEKVQEPELFDLAKVSASDSERQYWAKMLKEGREAEDTLDKLDEAETKMGEQRIKAEADLSKLVADLPDQLLAFAMGGPRKILQEHRKKISELRSTILDYNDVLPVFEKKKTQARHHIGTATTIEQRIRDRIKETEAKAVGKKTP